MDDLFQASRTRWLDGYQQTLASILETADRGQALGHVAHALLPLTGANQAIAILMHRDTVIGEAAAGVSSGEDDPLRKAVARRTLNAIRRSEQSGAPDHDFESLDGRTFLTVTLPSGIGATACLSAPAPAREALEHALALLAAGASVLASRQGAGAPQASTTRGHPFESVAGQSAGGSGGAGGAAGVGAVAYLKPVAELERDAIELALRTTAWNKEEAARRLGISRASIYMKVKKLGLQKPPVA